MNEHLSREQGLPVAVIGRLTAKVNLADFCTQLENCLFLCHFEAFCRIIRGRGTIVLVFLFQTCGKLISTPFRLRKLLSGR